MWKKSLLLIPALLFTGMSFVDVVYSPSYKPVLMTRSNLEASAALHPQALPIEYPTKLYVCQTWIFLVEKYKGLHLIDNTDPKNPVRTAFLTIPGCQDVAVANGMLYVDNAIDLVGVSVDLDALTAHEVSRVRGVLPELVGPDGYIPSAYRRKNRPDHTEIVAWIPSN